MRAEAAVAPSAAINTTMASATAVRAILFVSSINPSSKGSLSDGHVRNFAREKFTTGSIARRLDEAELRLLPGGDAAAIPIDLGVAGADGAERGVVGFPTARAGAEENDRHVAAAAGQLLQRAREAPLRFVAVIAEPAGKRQAARIGQRLMLVVVPGVDQEDIAARLLERVGEGR